MSLCYRYTNSQNFNFLCGETEIRTQGPLIMTGGFPYHYNFRYQLQTRSLALYLHTCLWSGTYLNHIEIS